MLKKVLVLILFLLIGVIGVFLYYFFFDTIGELGGERSAETLSPGTDILESVTDLPDSNVFEDSAINPFEGGYTNPFE